MNIDPGACSPEKGARYAPLAALVILIAVFLSYSNTFDVPFLYDDLPNILENPDIRQFPPALFSDSADTGLSRRPLITLTLAANYAASETDTWSWHVFNLVVHLTGVLLFFGLVRRTLLLPKTAPVFGPHATPLAFFSALTFGLHPLNTQAVTYIIQRCESLAGLFYLGVLYSTVRAASADRAAGWRAASLVFLILGGLTKEILLTAPAALFLFEWVFVQKSPARLWRQSPAFYAALILIWAVLAAFALSPLLFAPTAPGQSGYFTRMEYALTQPHIILHYLSLYFRPVGQALDYWWQPDPPGAALGFGLVLALLLGLSLWALARRYAPGFCGTLFFLALAPSSSIVPLNNMAFEHRMYLSTAALAALLAPGLYWLWKKFGKQAPLFPLWTILAVACLALGAAAYHRNADYNTPLSLWQDNVKKRPQNPRAHDFLGMALFDAGSHQAGISHFQTAIKLWPEFSSAWYNLGNAAMAMGDLPQAARFFGQAIKIDPDFAQAHTNLAIALARAREYPRALFHFQEAVRLEPLSSGARVNLARALFRAGQKTQALEQFQKAVELNPSDPEARRMLDLAVKKMSGPE